MNVNKKEMIHVLATEFNQNGLIASHDLLEAIAELWDLNSSLARRIEKGIKEISPSATMEDSRNLFDNAADIADAIAQEEAVREFVYNRDDLARKAKEHADKTKMLP
jgi:spermidine/putrescine-binding protein